MSIFKGSGVALITPFTKDDSVDFEKLGELLEYHIKNKTDAIIINGTTGESATLTDEEKYEIIKYSVKRVNGRIPVIAGTGSNNTKHAVELSKKAEALGVDGLLIVTPYYNKGNENGIYEHYKLIAENVNCPIILYNVPSRTGVNLSISLLKKLVEIKNIVAIKEASGNISYAGEIAREVPELDIYSGNDDMTIPLMSYGGIGVISVSANIIPETVHNMCMSFLENNFFLLAVTFGVFFFAKLLQKKTGLVLLNPILLTIAVLIIFLKMANISYETYNQGGHLIEFWLRPAVVALGVPLYLQLEMIKKQLLPILLSQLAGCIVGVISVVLIAKFMGASQEVILSLAPKSVTTPIAMEVTKAIGGIPSLTAAVVVAVGLLGAICGFKTMKIMHVGSPIAQGLSMGTAAHAVGTSTAMDISSKYGAYASLGLTLNGIFTALLTPTILRLLGVL